MQAFVARGDLMRSLPGKAEQVDEEMASRKIETMENISSKSRIFSAKILDFSFLIRRISSDPANGGIITGVCTLDSISGVFADQLQVTHSEI